MFGLISCFTETPFGNDHFKDKNKYLVGLVNKIYIKLPLLFKFSTCGLYLGALYSVENMVVIMLIIIKNISVLF